VIDSAKFPGLFPMRLFTITSQLNPTNNIILDKIRFQVLRRGSGPKIMDKALFWEIQYTYSGFEKIEKFSLPFIMGFCAKLSEN
jgi:hypothetical protein